MLHKVISLVAWLMPLILLAVGYYFYDALRQPVTWPWAAPAEVWGPLFLIFAILVAWLVMEFIYATHRNTSVRQLQADDFVSLFVALWLTFVAGGLCYSGTMQWFYVLPWIGSLIDAATSGFFAINNAAQKPFMSQQGIR